VHGVVLGMMIDDLLDRGKDWDFLESHCTETWPANLLRMVLST
jgi:hypothetical protein